MASSNLRHLYFVLGREARLICYCFFAWFLLSEAQAQPLRGTHINLRNYDEQRLHYGFSLAVNFTRFHFQASPSYAASDTLIQALVSPGFALGLLAAYRLNRFWELRLAPTASFNERVLRFKDLGSNGRSDQLVEATYVDLPLLFRYNSLRRDNARMFMLLGLSASFTLSRKAPEDNLLRIRPFDLAIEFGFGLEKFFPMFKFAPELRFAQGLINVLEQDNNPYSGQLRSLYNQRVSLYLFFE